MNGILAWGLDIVRVIQSMGNPALTAAMKALSFLGSEHAYLLLLPFFYWCVDERKGLKLGFVFFVSSWLNASLKTLWAQPRPYDFDPAVGLAHEKTYGLPSGHAQGSAVFWGVVGSWLRRPRGLLVAAALPLAVGFSRVYLGVHFPTDVFAGWALGLLVLALYAAFGPLAEALFAAASPRVRLIAFAAAALAMNALHREDVSFGAVLLGMGAGYVLMRERWSFRASLGASGGGASAAERAARYGIGVAALAVLYVGLKALFPGEDSAYYRLFRFLRYGALGFWVSAGAPWLFLRLKLAAQPRPAT